MGVIKHYTETFSGVLLTNKPYDLWTSIHSFPSNFTLLSKLNGTANMLIHS